VKGWQDSVASMNASLQKQVEEYQKQSSVMAPAKKDAEEKRLGDLNVRLREFAAQKLDARTGEAAQEREKRLAPIGRKSFVRLKQSRRKMGLRSCSIAPTSCTVTPGLT